MNVYTDGSCINNGKSNARAGIGIYFGNNDSRNISNELKGETLSNNVAELVAIITVFSILKKEIKNNLEINIYSDSEYSINSISKWYPNWCKNNKLEGKKNIELIAKAYKLFKKYKNVNLYYIKAHTNLKDEHSIGNSIADTLAGEAIGIKKFKYTETTNNTNNTNKNNDDFKLSFGKYKGRSVLWVLEHDENYINWCIDNLSNQHIVEKLKTLLY
tara:strand:- start:6238 stop:6885 length:648 start_codon:yes stop_codon:yes gene_type:complete